MYRNVAIEMSRDPNDPDWNGLTDTARPNQPDRMGQTEKSCTPLMHCAPGKKSCGNL